jgi:hypothetical protein
MPGRGSVRGRFQGSQRPMLRNQESGQDDIFKKSGISIKIRML